MPKTYYLANALIDHVVRGPSSLSVGAAYPRPGKVYVGLFTASPSPSGGGTEVSGGSYIRLAASFSAPTNGASSNETDLVFPTATALWGTIPYFGLFDQLSGGNLLYFSALNVAQSVVSGDTMRFPIGHLALSEI